MSDTPITENSYEKELVGFVRALVTLFPSGGFTLTRRTSFEDRSVETQIKVEHGIAQADAS